MRNFSGILIRIWVVAICAGLTACAGRTVVESDLQLKGAPDWVNEGTNILKNRNGRLFHGVGSAPPLGDMSLQMSTADDRARAEVARILSSYMEVVSRDYAAVASAGESSQEQTIQRQIDNVTHVNLAGSRIIAHWRDKKSNVIYALAELDMQQVQSTLRSVQDMNAGFKDHMVREGDNIFDSMIEDKAQ
jgi:hypothetical protein